MPDRPTTGQLRGTRARRNDRRTPDSGVIPYNVESRDMGGWREVIEPEALRSARLDDLTVLVEHGGVPLGRYPRTLELQERSDGLHWSVEPPRSRQDIIEAVERGDLQAASWRMRVARDSWTGDVRHIHEIGELRDVSITANPAYPAATVELRSQRHEEGQVPETTTTETPQEATVSPQEPTEVRSNPNPQPDPERAPAGSLRVEDRASVPGTARGLADEFRHRGFPGERAVIEWDEFESRAVTWSASIDALSQVRRDGVPLGTDTRYAWPAFGRIGVGADVTSVVVFQQVTSVPASGGDVIRDIDETSPKPETSSSLNIATVPLKQVASVQTAIPNVYLAQPSFNTVIESDLRLAINNGLDLLVLTELAKAGYQAPSPIRCSCRSGRHHAASGRRLQPRHAHPAARRRRRPRRGNGDLLARRAVLRLQPRRVRTPTVRAHQTDRQGRPGSDRGRLPGVREALWLARQLGPVRGERRLHEHEHCSARGSRRLWNRARQRRTSHRGFVMARRQRRPDVKPGQPPARRPGEPEPVSSPPPASGAAYLRRPGGRVLISAGPGSPSDRYASQPGRRATRDR